MGEGVLALPVEEVLSLWRQLERAEGNLPADSSERRVVQFEIVQLRQLYQRLTEKSTSSEVLLTAAHVQMGASRNALRRARARLDQE
jgi:hypothetical protein